MLYKLRYCVVALLLAACAHGYIHTPPRAGTANTKVVKAVVHIVGEPAFRRTGYWRSEDQPNYPWFLVLAGDGTACPVFEHTIYEPRTQEYFTCPTQWRVKRP